ncbi:small peptidoglycan-associated lipoprotein [Cytobacillus spongiae]|uniref:small peptidoglycan-associated lipoprotein n=1 Tax=Cytobacillus spongiae TaxID=2901381 RepID=UPI001F1D80C5|nr:small peptidoglycan-associated lipoprotein [Cytobacillus spongiae]UII57247.1 small peptidoglycan-associated lipoprotein [Cytobacillus spongiae]
MKSIQWILIASLFLLFANSCTPTHTNRQLELNPDEKQIIFFSDETDYQIEASYYDAIIELKKKFPKEVSNMQIIPAERVNDYYDFLQVKSCPAILVLYKNDIAIKINGHASKEEIIVPISEFLADDI